MTAPGPGYTWPIGARVTIDAGEPGERSGIVAGHCVVTRAGDGATVPTVAVDLGDAGGFWDEARTVFTRVTLVHIDNLTDAGPGPEDCQECGRPLELAGDRLMCFSCKAGWENEGQF